jgi:hypothetical protein
MDIFCLFYLVTKHLMPNVLNVLGIFMQFLNLIKLCPKLQYIDLRILISESFMVPLTKLNLNFNLHSMYSSENNAGVTFYFCNRSKGIMQWTLGYYVEIILTHWGEYTRWFKYDRDYLCVNKSLFVPVIFEPPCNSGTLWSNVVKINSHVVFRF